MKIFRRLLNSSWKDQVTNQTVRERIKFEIGDDEPLLEAGRRRKMQFYGHTSRQAETLAHQVLQVMVEDIRPRGRLWNN
eukprot:gene7284-12979_t